MVRPGGGSRTRVEMCRCGKGHPMREIYSADRAYLIGGEELPKIRILWCSVCGRVQKDVSDISIHGEEMTIFTPQMSM